MARVRFGQARAWPFISDGGYATSSAINGGRRLFPRRTRMRQGPSSPVVVLGRRRFQNRKVPSWFHLRAPPGRKRETTSSYHPSRPTRRNRPRRRRADVSSVRADVRTGELHRVPHRYRCVRRARRARYQHPGPRRLRRRRQDRRAATATR